MKRTWMAARAAVLALMLAGTGGCAAAAVAGAGAAGGIYLTNQGAEGVVEGSMAQVAQRTTAVLSEMNIEVTGHKMEADEHEWEGKSGDMTVHVEVSRESDTTSKVSVSARKNMVDYDKDYARSILQRIVTR